MITSFLFNFSWNIIKSIFTEIGKGSPPPIELLKAATVYVKGINLFKAAAKGPETSIGYVPAEPASCNTMKISIRKVPVPGP